MELIESFFKNPSEYIDFYIKLKISMLASSDGKCMAILKKMDTKKWGYVLCWMPNSEIWVGELIKPFKPSIKNVEKFNKGCLESARRLRIYIETMDPNKVPVDPPPFGDLTYTDEVCDAETFLKEFDAEENNNISGVTDEYPQYWFLVDESVTDCTIRTYVNTGSVKESGSKRTAWIKIYTDPPGKNKMNNLEVWEVLMLQEFDCTLRRVRPLRIIFHYDNGVAGEPFSVKPDWHAVTNRNEEITFDYVCQLKPVKQ